MEDKDQERERTRFYIFIEAKEIDTLKQTHPHKQPPQEESRALLLFGRKMPFLIVNHTPLSTSSNYLSVVLRGHVTKSAVHAIKEAIVALRQSDLELVRLPLLRVERGVWQFNATCKYIHHATVLYNCFFQPLEKLEWLNTEILTEQRRHFEGVQALISAAKTAEAVQQLLPLPFRPPNIPRQELKLLQKVEPLQGFKSVVYAKSVEEEPGPYRPFTGVVFGGGGAVVEPNPMGSFDVLEHTIMSLEDRDYIVIGCGWEFQSASTTASPVQKMLAGEDPFDLDLKVYQLNKYGDIIGEEISPKKSRNCSGISMWPDSKTGIGDHFDDERVLIQMNKLHPNVRSLLFTLSITSGPTSFNRINNLYLRMVDCSKGVNELELWRYNLDQLSAPDYYASVVACRISNEDQMGWKAETLGKFFRSRVLARPQVVYGDVLTHINHKPVNPCTWVGSNSFSYNMSMLRKALMFNVCTLTFKRPEKRLNSATAHIGNAFMDKVGESFDITFDPDGDSDCGITFREYSSSVIVKSVDHRKYNPKYDLNLSSTGISKPCAKPTKIRFSNIEARVPAMDRGGTTDVYLKVGVKVPSTRSSMFGKGFETEKLVKTKPVKTQCPANVKFDGVVIEVPLKSSVGVVPRCTFEVYDCDSMSKDDIILRHDFDITYRFVDSNRESIEANPDFVCEIEDMKANVGFTKADCTLRVTAELLFDPVD